MFDYHGDPKFETLRAQLRKVFKDVLVERTLFEVVRLPCMTAVDDDDAVAMLSDGDALKVIPDHRQQLQRKYSAKRMFLNESYTRKAIVDGNMELFRDCLDLGHYGGSVFFTAFTKGTEEMWRMVLSKSEDGVNSCFKQLIVERKWDKVRILIDEGFKVETRERREAEALQCEVASQPPEVVDMFLSGGAVMGNRSLFRQAYFILCMYKQNRTPARLPHLRDYLLRAGASATALRHLLHEAVSRGDHYVASLALEHGACRVGGASNAVLPLAARANDVRMMRILLDGGVSVNETNEKGKTALNVAARHGADGVVRLLLERKADVEKLSGKRTPLMNASAKGFAHICRDLLAQGADVDHAVAGKTAIICAAECGRLNCVDVLRRHNADVNARSDLRWTALLHAARQNLTPMCTMLLGCGADVCCLDAFGKSCLLYAVYHENLDLCSALLAGGSIPTLNTASSQGFVPLIVAAQRENTQILTLLCTVEGLDMAATYQGSTALFFTTRIEVMEILLAYGADVSARNANGDTRLMQCVGFDTSIAEFLLGHGADPNVVNLTGKTALYNAVEHENRGLVATLLAHGALVDICCALPALNCAVEKNFVAISELLLAVPGVMLNRCHDLSTPLMLAVRNNNLRLCERILQKSTGQASVAVEVQVLRKVPPAPQEHCMRGYGYPSSEEEGEEEDAFSLNMMRARKRMDYADCEKELLQAIKEERSGSVDPDVVDFSVDSQNFIPTETAAIIDATLPPAAALVNTRCAVTQHSALHLAVLASAPHIVRLLLAHGGDVLRPFCSGNASTPCLAVAAAVGCAETAALLVGKGADVNEVDSDGRACLFHCCNAAVARVLLDGGADVDVRDAAGNTLAMISHNTGLLEALLRSGADANASNAGKTCLMHAVSGRRHHSLAVVALLLDYGAIVDRDIIAAATFIEVKTLLERAFSGKRVRRKRSRAEQQEDNLKLTCKKCGVSKTSSGNAFATEESLMRHVAGKHRLSWVLYKQEFP